jgi:aminoglycoside phosphotransferase (APT) family kinase protein
MTKSPDAGRAALGFAVDGTLESVAPYGSGHINDSYCAVFEQAGRRERFLLQKINTHVFLDPAALMENIERVTTHLAGKGWGSEDGSRRMLTLARARDGQAWLADANGASWRMYRFIEGARSYDAVENAAQAYEAARAFGEFQRMLADLPGPRLNETIPDFHDTPKRLAALKQAIESDAPGRAEGARREIDFVFAHESVTRELVEAGLPERVTHNDTKINNVLLDERSGKGICVIDLETVMPGLAPFDFGDMVRTMSCRAAEDERDLSLVRVEMEMFEALARGYLSVAGGFLKDLEKSMLVEAGRVITLEQGIRFLTDYLQGDRYFKVHREGQNLDRARTQFRLVESLEEHRAAMERAMERAAN